MPRPLLLGLLLLLAPSGAFAQTAPAVPRGAATAAPAKDDRPLIVCVGDSLTSGNGMEGSYPFYLQHNLDRDGFRFRVQNMGMPASTTADWLPRLGSITTLKPAFVLLELGGSDGLAGKVPVAQIEGNLGKIIHGLEAGGAQVMLLGIRMPDGFDPVYAKQFGGVYTTVAETWKLPLLPFLYEGVYKVPGMMEGDGIHATQGGNEVIARHVAAFIEPLLGERATASSGRETRGAAGQEVATSSPASHGACPIEIHMNAREQLFENRMHGLYRVSRQTLASDLSGGCKLSPTTSVLLDFDPRIRYEDALALLSWTRERAPDGITVELVAPKAP